MLCGIALLGPGIFPQQIVGSEFGDFYINGQKIEDQTTYSLGTKETSFQYIPTEQLGSTGTNLLSNPGFELDENQNGNPEPWGELSGGNPVGFTSWETGGYEGQHCVKSVITSFTTTYGLMGWKYFGEEELRNLMEEATTYQIRFAYKTSGCTGANAVRVNVRYFASGWDYETAPYNVAFYPSSSSWTISEPMSFTTPSGVDWADTAYIGITISIVVVGEMLLDNVELFQPGASQPSNIEAVRLTIEGSYLSDTVAFSEQADNSWVGSYSFQDDGEYALTVLVTTASVEETALATSLTIATEPESEESPVGTDPETADAPTPTGTSGSIEVPIGVGSALGFGLIAAGLVFVVSKQKAVSKPKKK